MEYLKLAFYVIVFVLCFLTVVIFAVELWKYIKLIPFLFLRALWWIRSLFSKKSEIRLKPTGSQFTGTLTTLDITTEKETAQRILVKQSFNRSEYAKLRKRNRKGHFIKV
jgi:hypothetical protein